MQRCSAPIRCWDAFGPQILPLVIAVNAPGPIPPLFFWMARALTRWAPKTFGYLCSVLHKRGYIRLRTQREIEAMFVVVHVKVA